MLKGNFIYSFDHSSKLGIITSELFSIRSASSAQSPTMAPSAYSCILLLVLLCSQSLAAPIQLGVNDALSRRGTELGDKLAQGLTDLAGWVTPPPAGLEYVKYIPARVQPTVESVWRRDAEADVLSRREADLGGELAQGLTQLSGTANKPASDWRTHLPPGIPARILGPVESVWRRDAEADALSHRDPDLGSELAQGLTQLSETVNKPSASRPSTIPGIPAHILEPVEFVWRRDAEAEAQPDARAQPAELSARQSPDDIAAQLQSFGENKEDVPYKPQQALVEPSSVWRREAEVDADAQPAELSARQVNVDIAEGLQSLVSLSTPKNPVLCSQYQQPRSKIRNQCRAVTMTALIEMLAPMRVR